WAAVRLLGRGRAPGTSTHSTENRVTRAYRCSCLSWRAAPARARDSSARALCPARWRWRFLRLTALLLLGAMALRPSGWVRVKMLPYDNKSELEIVLDMPEGSSLERTAQVAREIAAALRQEKEVTDYQVYVGTSAPHGFNGLMR